MVAIYLADIWCDSCIEHVKFDIAKYILKNKCDFPNGSECNYDNVDDIFEYLESMNEEDYDSDNYPKYCPDSEEFYCPQHCAECDIFLGNDLTCEGADYVKESIIEDLECGRHDSVAVTEWALYYDYIDYRPWEQCGDCGKWHKCC